MKIFNYHLKPCTNAQAMFWNMAGTMCFAAQSVLLLAMVSRICGTETAGIFSLTYSYAQMMYLISCFESSSVLITDSKKEFSQGNAFLFRFLTNGIMAVAAMVFCYAQGFDGQKQQIFYLLVLYMAILSAIDLCESLLHKNGYLNLSGISRSVSIVLGTAAFFISLLIRQDLRFSILCMCISVFAWFLIFDVPYVRLLEKTKATMKTKVAMRLLFQLCIPLLCMRLGLSYITNSPKLAIDKYLSLTDQSYYGYLLMPASFINMMSLFIYRPQLVNMAESYTRKDKKRFKKIVGVQLLCNLIIAIGVLVSGYFLGIPVLSLIYGVDLAGYEFMLCTILMGGCFYAYAMLFETLTTAMRCHQWNLLVYAPALIMTVTFIDEMVRKNGLMGAAWSYMLLMLLLALGSGTILVIFYKKRFANP